MSRNWEMFKGRPREWRGRIVRREGEYRQKSDKALLTLRNAGVPYHEIARIIGYGSIGSVQQAYYDAKRRLES